MNKLTKIAAKFETKYLTAANTQIYSSVEEENAKLKQYVKLLKDKLRNAEQRIQNLMHPVAPPQAGGINGQVIPVGRNLYDATHENLGT